MTNLDALIDAYAAIKNEIASLEATKKQLEGSMADLPKGAYESEKYRLTIINTLTQVPDEELAAEQKLVAANAIEAYRETLSRQYLTAHTVDKTVRSHRVGLKTGKNLAAA